MILCILYKNLTNSQQNYEEYEITLNSKTKNVNNANDAFPTRTCCEAIRKATIQHTEWQEICDSVAQVALKACQASVDRSFKVTCAVYKQDAFSYHASYKKSLGGYYQFDLKNSEQEFFTFVYKRTMHGSQGMDIKASEVLSKLQSCEPLGFSNLSYNI